jgi:hypothetical protein
MKKHIKTNIVAGVFLAVLALVLCQTARADLAAQIPTAYPGGGTSWATDPGGNSPFYSSANVGVSGNFSGQSQQTPASGAPASVLAETITITNTAGITTVVANTNYVLTGISLLFSGFDNSHTYSLHVFDVTTNLTGGVIASGASYNFAANGDLLGGGNGNGVGFTNQYLSGAEQQDYFGLKNGPISQDRIVLGAGHTYAIEVWVPSGSSSFFAQKCSAVPQDAGGELMASTDSRLTHSRITGSASGFYGSSEHTWAIALYGYPTNAAPTLNSNGTNAITNLVIDDFNPTNNPYSGTNNYASTVDNEISNVWANWFGGAFSNVVWDAAGDAQGNANSGALKITGNFPGQYAVWNQGPGTSFPGISPPITNGLGLLTFQCDIRFDPSSCTTVNGSVTNYGHLQFGTRTSGYGQDYWSPAIEVPVANTNWVHVSIPLNASADANLLSVNDIVVHIDGGWYGSHPLNGASILWVDNIQFTALASAPAAPPPPTLAMQQATPALRIFAGSVVNTYDREELSTLDSSQSWIGGTYPVSYSFTLLSYPNNNINQTHIFLVPANTSGQANMGNSSANEYIEYQASNTLWLVLGPNGGGRVTASVQWKTNLPNANPDHTALVFTNSTAIGTWTLTFTGDNAGTLTAPGGSPVPFTITNGTVATDFANPLVAYFGLQPNSSAGEGLYEDWASILVTNVAGVNESEDFTKKPTTSVTASGLWFNNSAQAASLQVVSTNLFPAYWISWSLPAVNYELGAAAIVTGSTNTPAPWMLPEYFNGYGDGTYPASESQQGSMRWVLLPRTCLPTVDGNPGSMPAPNAYFQLFKPPLAN